MLSALSIAQQIGSGLVDEIDERWSLMADACLRQTLAQAKTTHALHLPILQKGRDVGLDLK